MARIFVDGFESGNQGCWDTWGIDFGGNIGTSYKYSGAYGVNFPYNTNYWLGKNVPSKTEYYAAIKVYPTGTGRSVISFREGTIIHGTLTLVNSAGSWYVGAYRGGSGSVWLGGSGTVHGINQYYKFQVYFKVDNVNGRFVVKVDGLTELDFTGDTANGGAPTIDNIRIGYDGGAWAAQGYMDDIVIDDAEYPGDTKVIGLKPTGAGNSAQWTPSTGNNWDCVDEVPVSDADYVSAAAINLLDTYTMEDVAVAVDQIKAVQVQVRIVREGASAAQNLALAVRTGSTPTDYFSPDKAVPTTYKGLSHLWAANPDTTNPWTVDEVNAMEAGFKSKT